jgi:predicted small lipoprotein YifL
MRKTVPPLLALLLFLAGCGMKGDLYLPAEPASPTPSAPSAEPALPAAPAQIPAEEDENKKPVAATPPGG